MRPRFSFPADEILRRASKIEVSIFRTGGKTIGIAYRLEGELLSPFDEEADDSDAPAIAESQEDAQRLLAALLEGGAA